MKTRILAFPAIALLLAAPLSAQPVAIAGLWNTGVDNTGTPLAGGSNDPHYSVLGNPAKVISISTPCNHPAWVVPTNACWIWENADGTPGSVTRTFRLSFDMSAYNPGTANISGSWSADNIGLDILINGASTGNTAGHFGSLFSFNVNSGFQTGINTLDFVVQDFGAPGGLLVQGIQGTAQLVGRTVVPEPGTYAMMAMGLLGLVAARSRRSKARSA